MNKSAGANRAVASAERPAALWRAICRTPSNGLGLRAVAGALFMLLVNLLGLDSALAEGMSVPTDEKPQLRACERRLCTMIVQRAPTGEDLQCNISKTWAKDTLKGGESKAVAWGFGDARCKVNINLSRAQVLAALTSPEYTFEMPSQKVLCEVERNGEVKPLTATLAPKIAFKNGQANKVWINLKEVKGPADIKGTIWTAAQLEDTVGLFHGKMIKAINKFMFKRCTERYSPQAMAQRKANQEKRRAAAKASTVPEAKSGAPPPASAAPADPQLPENAKPSPETTSP